jgi:hypothetical protein
VERRRRAGRRLMSELVGLNSQTPDIMGKLSQLLTISGQRAQVQQEQQTAHQRANLAKYDWNKHVGADGTIDIESLNDPELMHAAGDQYQNVLANAIATKQNQLSAQKTLIGLRGDQRQAFGEIMNGLRSDADVAEDNERGRQKVNEAMVQYGQQYGVQVLPVLEAYVKPLQKAPKGRLADALKIIGLQTESVDTQLSQQSPQYMNTGPELVDINPNTAPGASPKSLKLGLGPGMQILTDAKGATFAFNPQTNTVTPVGSGGRGPAPSGPAPTGPAPTAAPGSTFTQPSYQGQEKDISRNQDEVATTRAAADQAPANRNIFQHILSLADDTKTGPLISYLQSTKIGGQVFGDNYQELGKYLEKNAIANMQAMGGPASDARLSAAVAANGSTQFNPKALKAVTEFNYATNTGLERYRQAMDNIVGTKNPDYTKLPELKKQWAKNFDMDVFRLENAMADGNTAAQNEILGSLSKERAAELKRKMKNLDALAEKGQLPDE